MASRRMISRDLTTSERFASLHQVLGSLAEFAQALYVFLVVFSDDFGRQRGDAFTVKHGVWPTSPRSREDFEAALDALHRAKLVVRYEDDNGRVCLQVANFDEHQKGGLTRRTSSKFPEPPGDSVNFSEIPPQGKVREGKVSEEKEAGGAAEQSSGSAQVIIKRKRPLADAEFLAKLQANPAYAHIDFAHESGAMDAWLLAHPERTKNRRFIVNWLNRVNRTPSPAQPEPRAMIERCAAALENEVEQ